MGVVAAGRGERLVWSAGPDELAVLVPLCTRQGWQ